MCKDGKCQERAGQIRNAVISLGTAARELSKVAGHPHMVVKTSLYIACVPADPSLRATPGITVVMEVYPTTDDVEIARKADRYLIENTRRKPAIIQVLEGLFGLPPTADAPDGPTDEAPRSALQTSAQIA